VDGFTPEGWLKLTKLERMAMCEEYALEADGLGQAALARQWRDLAAEIKAAP
jgi:hypothetical protein